MESCCGEGCQEDRLQKEMLPAWICDCAVCWSSKGTRSDGSCEEQESTVAAPLSCWRQLLVWPEPKVTWGTTEWRQRLVSIAVPG